jgi:hypothetical protein
MRVILLLLCLVSCTPSFQHSHYRKRYVPNKWVRKHVPVIKTGTYRNPLIKKEIRQEMLVPKTINLDKW